MTRWAMVAATAAVLGGCPKKGVESALPALKPAALRVALAERPVPDPATARLSVKLTSDKLRIHAPPLGGGLVVDRPGRAWFALLNPLGQPVLTVTSDGADVAVTNTRDRQVVLAKGAAADLGLAADGAVGLDDVVALLVGLLPVDADKARFGEAEGGVGVRARGPAGTEITAVVDAGTGAPRAVDVTDTEGKPLVHADYEPFALQGDAWLPTRVTLYVTPLDLRVDVRYKSWSFPDEAPDVFGITVPDGFSVVTPAELAEAMKAGDDGAPSSGSDTAGESSAKTGSETDSERGPDGDARDTP